MTSLKFPGTITALPETTAMMSPIFGLLVTDVLPSTFSHLTMGYPAGTPLQPRLSLTEAIKDASHQCLISPLTFNR